MNGRLAERVASDLRRHPPVHNEGHAWEGDFKHGWWVADDDMWNCLSSSQLDRLRKIIDG